MKIGRNDPCPCGSGRKYKKCHYRKIFTHQSEKFTISVKKDGVLYKICKIMFHQTKNTDSAAVFISFPYHKNSNGLLSLVTFPKNKQKVDKLSLIPGGKITSHKIKYTHWKDGNVHFSQDRKIYTIKKEQSDSLDKSIGHLFSIHIKGLKGFEVKSGAKKFNQKEIDLDFDIGQGLDDSIKITGWWYDCGVVHPQRDEFTKVYIFRQDDGFTNRCFALQAPSSSPLSNKILFLCARKEFMTKERGTHLLFIGGFDKKEKSKDINNDLHFLAMLYPARNYKNLKDKIGSIDFVPTTTNLHLA